MVSENEGERDRAPRSPPRAAIAGYVFGFMKTNSIFSGVRLGELHHRPRRAVHGELEDVRPRVVAGDVQLEA